MQLVLKSSLPTLFVTELLEDKNEKKMLNLANYSMYYLILYYVKLVYILL